MPVRPEVQDLVNAGPFPPENQATEEQLVILQQRLEAVPRPVTVDEARELSTAFGPDDCFGLCWTLLHLIETAPDTLTADPPIDRDNEWTRLLADRAKKSRNT